MNNPIDLHRVRHRLALDAWLEDCRHRMAQRYPLIDFESVRWQLRTLHGSEMIDYNLADSLADFAGKDPNFAHAFRCIAAERVLVERNKVIKLAMRGFRLLHATAVPSLFKVDHAALRAIEEGILEDARRQLISAKHALEDLQRLGRDMDMLSSRGVLPRLRFDMRRETRSELLAMSETSRKRWRQAKAAMLDHRIEALSEAFNALFAGDPRLFPADKVALAMLGLEMCAPSRVNEMLCLAVDDHVTVDDYAHRGEGKDFDQLYTAHQLLLVTMKGSKGAQWGPKPVLNFMIDFFHYCTEVIQAHGTRSRMLVEWYQQHPDTLYLPPELEYLRGRDVSRSDLRKILYMSESRCLTTKSNQAQENRIFAVLRHAVCRAPNLNPRGKRTIEALPWTDLEAHLLGLVRDAMAKCRAVTKLNHYKGNLAKMLFLFDYLTQIPPFLPQAATYEMIRRRLKRWTGDRGLSPTLFARLGITMPVDGKIEVAEIATHDPRRFLTTNALRYGEKLSDVLVSKWANRLSLSQLKAYDFRAPEEKADASAMPDVHELRDLSSGLAARQRMEDVCGLKPEIVTVHDAGISVTSMDAICTATENRPVARTAEQIIVMYPSWYGICTHQHHENPCRAYASCLPCDENIVVKGHLPTNEHVRERKDMLHRAIVAQLENLVITHNRGIADDEQQLSEHILALAGNGLDPEQMAGWLIDHFHSIRDQIRDISFRNRLEEAFVAKGFVKRLDDPDVPSGAQIKYHNPSRHAAPGLERALDAHGGREAVEQMLEECFKVYPQFAPQQLGLKDQRDLLALDEDDDSVETEDGNE